MNFSDNPGIYQDLEVFLSPMDEETPFPGMYPGSQVPVFLFPLDSYSQIEAYHSSPRFEEPCSESTNDEFGSSEKKEEKRATMVSQTGTAEPKPLIGKLTFAQRQAKLERFRAKRLRRVWSRRINYDCRKKVADSRIRYKGRFVKKEDSHLYLPVPKPQESGN
jgi:hypothetical protein